ncbi:TetR family transcriptional regulator [Streptomyces cinnamoneus]|uniref:TetR family transcriptional regulator n=1 Tax=Streptomyces cinnamoneus TaxID=53446 RepID=A0A2G1XGA6_STRCJ|nr:TetR/AcrR family transcriptional regulator [Streptomyces cinnamoneus]PHQ50266.1 TetR family transcriptional regulator [Streptomyces cinnamoneus]PPT12948.1 TetR family transcriptional regulator [Streptomyces cinnamoneus]
MATPRTPDSTRRSERSRRAIFDAALELVGEVGYDKLTIEGIAARAGVGKQTIYRWWPSKAAVLLDAFTADAGDYEAGLPDTGDLAADLRFVLRASVDEFNDPKFQAPYRALAAAGANDAELSADFVARLMEPGIKVYTDRLRAARDQGQVAEDADLRVAAEMLLGPFSQRWLMRTGPLTYEFTDTLVDLVVRAVARR